MKFNNRNIYISPSAKIGDNVKIGDNTSIYDNVEIADNTIIANDCVIGEPIQNYYQNDLDYVNPKTYIGFKSSIRSHTIIYSGCMIGDFFSTGHRVTIRENTFIGNHCRIGTLSDIQGDCKIGNYCWLHSNVHICKKALIGDFVFIYPFAVLTNDPIPPSNNTKGPTVGDFSQISVKVILLPGVIIGKHCLIGAGSIVSSNVNDFMLAVGSPAKEIKRVDQIISKSTGKSHYPWPYSFERGMPWEGIGYEKWSKNNNLV